ncbi:MAG TPA: class I SAM-dependent methyltransferase [Acidimicrobiales bacterium]|nr:class I SAM-dependent methyltransferase [Acidimicrobiales bacterium]
MSAPGEDDETMTTRRPLRPGMPDGFDGRRYQERFDALEKEGKHVHGEADLVSSFAPESVLDAGCGTGRVALELARRGVLVVGVDRDPSMLAVAEERAARLREELPGVRVSFVAANLVGLDLAMSFDVVVMAGNVPLFTDPGTEALLVSSVAGHVRPGGVLVAGFQLGRSYSLADYDLACRTAGLVLADRFGTWERDPFEEGGEYAVSVHRRG